MKKEDLKNLSEKFGYIVYNISSKYVRGFPSKSDDIIASANLGMIEGLTQAIRQEKEVEEMGGYVWINVHKEIINFLIADKLVPIPRSYIRKMKIEAMDRGELETFTVQSLFPILFHLAKSVEDDTRVAKNEWNWWGVLDIMDWLKLTDLEKQVCWYKIQGYTYREIAEKMECSAMWPNLVMKEVKKKCEKKKYRWPEFTESERLIRSKGA